MPNDADAYAGPLRAFSLATAPYWQKIITDRHPARRPPVVSAKMMALAMQLGRAGRAWPPHMCIGRYFGCTMSAVSRELTKCLGRGLLVSVIVPLNTPALWIDFEVKYIQLSSEMAALAAMLIE